MDTVHSTHPPLSPAPSETRASGNENFIRECVLKISHLGELGHIKIESELLMESKKWGLIFRADFTINEKKEEGFLNRFLCWDDKSGKIKTMFAMHQEIGALY